MSRTQQTQTNDEQDNVDKIEDSEDIFDAVQDLIDDILNAANEQEAREIVTNYLEQANTLAVSRYSFRNQVALIKQMNGRNVEFKNEAEHFAGFNTWMEEHGRHVKTGESGFKILAPRTGLVCPDCGNAPNYHRNDWLDCERAGTNPSTWEINPADEWSEGVIYFTTATTFAYPQTAPLDDADDDEVFTPDIDEGRTVNANDENAAALFDALTDAAESGAFDVGEIKVETVGSASLGLSAAGASTGGQILIKDKDNTAEQFRTLAHEIAHELLHQDESDTLDPDDELTRPVQETEAEAIAHAVTSAVGMEPEGSELYVSTWTEHARTQGDDDDDVESPREAIKNRLVTVQETAAEIVEVTRERTT
jgi:hypothetical protein